MTSTPPPADRVHGKLPHPAPPATNGSKKRKRKTCSGISLGEASSVTKIKGVPPHLTSSLLLALKSRRRCLSEKGKTEDRESAGSLGDGTDSNATVTDGILDRLRRKESTETEEQAKLRKAAEDATQDLLKALRRESSIAQRRSRKTPNDSPSSVPVACLTFLIDILSDTRIKIPTRRSALELGGELLRRSADCREMFSTAERMREFVAVVADINKAGNARPSNGNGDGTSTLIQYEAVELLGELSSKFGSIYPRLAVAARYLEERRGIVVCTRSVHPGGGNISMEMAELRRVRDVALEYSEKESKKVRRILDRADVCFDLLVPRFGFGDSQKVIDNPEHDAATNGQSGKKEGTSSWSDDDDVDWEDVVDGDGEYLHSTSGLGVANSQQEFIYDMMDHEHAVERTISVMERTGGTFGGGLEINFDAEKDEDETKETSNGNEKCAMGAARATVQKCVDLLSSRHVPRLTCWVDALISADGMMDQRRQQPSRSVTASSLVLMPATLRQKRGSTLRMLMELKSEVARVLASASRLGICSGQGSSLLSEEMGQAEKVNDRLAPRPCNNTTSSSNFASHATSASTSPDSWREALGIAAKKGPTVKDQILSKGTKKRACSVKKTRVQIKLRK